MSALVLRSVRYWFDRRPAPQPARAAVRTRPIQGTSKPRSVLPVEKDLVQRLREAGL